MEDEWVSRYPVQVVGGANVHQELWVPAEELDEFNHRIIGEITIVAVYTGPQFPGTLDPQTHRPLP